MRIKLRYKLLGYSVALAIIPLAVAAWTMIRITQDELKSSANEAISATAEQLAAEIDNLYSDTWLAPLQLVASGIESESLGIQEKIALLQSGIQNIADVVAVQISARGLPDESAILIRKDEFSTRLEERDVDARDALLVTSEQLELLQANASEGTVASSLHVIESVDSWLLTVVLPLQHPLAGREATLSARIDLGRLRSVIAAHPFNKTGTVLLVDAAGRQLFDPQNSDLSSLSIVADARERLASGMRATTARPYVRPSGEAVLAAYSIPQNLDWSVVAEMEEDKAYRTIGVMLRSLRKWIVLGLAIAVVGGLFFAQRISRPVEEVARTAQEVRKGNLEVEVRERRSRDEIGELAKRINEMIRGLRERDFIRDTFGRYVSPEVAQQVLSDPTSLHPGGDLRTVTVLMSDLRGFTSLSEQLSPPEMVEILNAYLGRMSDIIARHDGTVIEFIGDAIMALFGAPTVQEDDPLHAVACAAEMHMELERFNAEYGERGVPPLQQGIGINTGEVIVGNIGSEKRMKYGVVGDDVNLAARAESLTVGGEVLVSESTRDAVGERAEFRGPIEVKVKGKKEPLHLFAVVAVGEPYGFSVPGEHRADANMVDVSVRAQCFRVTGKVVADTPVDGTIVRIGVEDAELEAEEGLKVFDNLKLRLFPPGGDQDRPIEDVYVKVMSADHEGEVVRYHVRFTSIREDERGRVFALMDGA